MLATLCDNILEPFSEEETTEAPSPPRTSVFVLFDFGRPTDAEPMEDVVSTEGDGEGARWRFP